MQVSNFYKNYFFFFFTKKPTRDPLKARKVTEWLSIHVLNRKLMFVLEDLRNNLVASFNLSDPLCECHLTFPKKGKGKHKINITWRMMYLFKRNWAQRNIQQLLDLSLSLTNTLTHTVYQPVWPRSWQPVSQSSSSRVEAVVCWDALEACQPSALTKKHTLIIFCACVCCLE